MKKILILLIVVVNSASSIAQELRAGIEMKQKLKPKIETAVNLELRNDLNSPDHFINKSILQANLGYSPVKHVEIAGTFRYSVKRKNTEETIITNSFKDKYRITADLTTKTKRFDNHIRLGNRLRYEYFIIEADKSKKMVRNKVKCDYKITKRVIPYMAIEPFYSPKKDHIDVIRFYAGSCFELRKNEIEVFTILEIKNEKDPIYTNQIFGVTYKF